MRHIVPVAAFEKKFAAAHLISVAHLKPKPATAQGCQSPPTQPRTRDGQAELSDGHAELSDGHAELSDGSHPTLSRGRRGTERARGGCRRGCSGCRWCPRRQSAGPRTGSCRGPPRRSPGGSGRPELDQFYLGGGARRLNTAQHTTMQCNPTQRNETQYRTMQHNTHPPNHKQTNIHM